LGLTRENNKDGDNSIMRSFVIREVKLVQVIKQYKAMKTYGGVKV
jgi:hypothetical protein